MTGLLEAFYTQTYMTMELLINSCVFFALLSKRRGFWPRLILGAAGCLLLRFVLPRFGTFTLLLTVLSVVAFVYLCCAVSIQDAVYCVVCAYATQHLYFSAREVMMYLQGVPLQDTPPRLTLSYLLLYAVILAAVYFFCARKLADGKHYNIDTKHSVVSLVLVLTVVVVLSLASQRFNVAEGVKLYVLCRCYAMFCCAFLLNSEVSAVKRTRLAKELNIQQMLLAQQEEQYQLTKENVELINRKCHDLKKQMSVLRGALPPDQREKELAQIENSIQIYDSTFRTGNEVLDIVLTRKSLDCEAHNIVMTCVADGKHLNFMEAADLFAIFGNALDNAIEAVMDLPEAEKRVVAVSVWERSGLVLMQFENYCAHPPVMRDDLPVTTKKDKDYHGFGMKSIRYAVQKYGGQMTVHTENNMFVLRISLPAAGA